MSTKTSKHTISKRVSAKLFLEKLTNAPLSLAELLNAIRQADSLSYIDFADKLGISKSHLCDILKGRKIVSLARAIEFADILGHSKDQFVRLSLQMQVDKIRLPYRVSIKAA